MQLIRIFFTFLTALTMAGCINHYYRNEPDAVVFYLKAPNAQNVQIAASYNGYDLKPVQRLNSDTWIVRLPNGTGFSYFYLVDGKLLVPQCKMMEQDDFGQSNCVFSSMP